MISIEEASNQLGVTVPNLYLSNKYNGYLHKSGHVKYDARYDIEAFRRNEMKEETFIARVGLLIEYLNKELNITYTYMAKLCGVTKQYLSGVVLSYPKAIKLVQALKETNHDDYEKFKKYYEMEL